MIDDDEAAQMQAQKKEEEDWLKVSTSSLHKNAALLDNLVTCMQPIKDAWGYYVPALLTLFREVDEGEALLVAGSSLTVHSGLRFVRHAARSGRPVVIVNRGATRGDDVATVRVDAGTSETLQHLAASLPAVFEDRPPGLEPPAG